MLPAYQIVEQLHDGSRTTVYRGRRKADGKQVILKTSKGASPTLPELARWRHEHQILARLDGSGTPRAYELAIVHNRPFLVLEDIGGRSLRDILGDGPLPVDDVLELAIAIAEVLGQIHARRVVHKDVNPANLVWNRSTRRVQVIDFGIASLLSREASEPLDVVRGTLAYISPEQTGRMNRAVDYRADFYSLGATLYELLTGAPPFRAVDAIELVHCHIARQPTAPHEVDPRIPPVLSRLVMKLLAKTAEERYQSAARLADDLRRCRQGWQERRAIADFPLGEHDLPDRLQLPQKIYGRDAERRTLLDAFDRIAAGGREVLLVSGYSGIGKTSLVSEVHRPIVRQRGLYAAGKFDQYRKDIPYSALVQAFTDVVRQLLAGAEEAVARVRRALADALGANAGVITDLVPVVEALIGPQPAAPPLPAQEAQNRARLAFRRFVRVLARREHPLVLFLDDMQWADLASLDLLEVLAGDPELESLLVIGAYRDNQVDAAHPLILTVERLKAAGATVGECVLAPLGKPHVAELAADALFTSAAEVGELAALLHERTGGNPFFVAQLLRALDERGLLRLDGGAWRWDIRELRKVELADDVAALMAAKIRTLPAGTQRVLQLAACVGNRFDLRTLAIVHDRTPRETWDALWIAMAEGLVVPRAGDYIAVAAALAAGTAVEPAALAEVELRFHHDQIQQAAYSLDAEADRPAVHLAIGRALLAHIPAAERAERVFELANHFNQAAKLITLPAERATLIGLDLAAGQRARASAAYGPGFRYLSAGLALLDDQAWETSYQQTLELHLEATEAAFLAGDLESMDRLIAVVLERARGLLDCVRAYEVRIQALSAQRRLPDALAVGLEVLAGLGEDLPAAPTLDDVGAAIGATIREVAGEVESLGGRPPMTDPVKLAAMDIMVRAFSAAYLSSPLHVPLLVSRQVQLSARHGNAPTSPYAYATWGLILCGVVGDLETGYRFGSLALALQDRQPDRRHKAKVSHVVWTFTRPWKDHVRTTLDPLLETYQIGVEVGDFEYGGYAALLHCYYSYFAGRELPAIDEAIVALARVTQQLKQEVNHRYFMIWRQAILNLTAGGDAPWALVGEAFDQRTALPALEEGNDRTGLFFVHYNQMVLAYLFGRPREAVAKAAQVEGLLDAVVAVMVVALFHFYDSLARLAVRAEATAAEREAIDVRVADNQAKLETWAAHAPMNHQHKWLLVEAERARAGGRQVEAMTRYDQAIALAGEHGFLQEEALAYELAGGFHLAAGRERVAAGYLADARLCYERWGATAKVRDLERRAPHLLERRRLDTWTPGSTSTGDGITGDSLDHGAILEMSRALSGELVLADLVRRFMRIAIENAGADRGVFVLARDGRLTIAAESTLEHDDVVVDADAPLDGARVPVALVTLVARTREAVVTGEGRPASGADGDPYLTARPPRSALALPLVRKGQLLGVLYLENRLAADLFAPRRIEVLKLLSAQLAISIYNARLYGAVEQARRDLEKQEAQVRQYLEALPLGVFVIDAAGAPLFVNQVAQSILGRGVVPGTPADRLADVYQAYVEGTGELYPPDRLPIVQALAGQPVTVEDMEIHQGDQVVPLRVTATPIHDERGRIQHAIAAFEDIRERKAAERVLADYNRTLEAEVRARTEEAAAAREAAESANRAKSAFLANMSHEIRTPLAALLGFADLLLDPGCGPSERLNYAHIVRRNGEHLLGLINDILDLSRIEAGKVTLESVACPLGALLADLEALMRVRAVESGLEFGIHLVTPIPAAIVTDPLRLKQILLNLIGNAIKFTRKGSVRVMVRHEPSMSPPLLYIDVADTGIGMTPEQLGRLFQPFQQADASTTRRYGGSGLGLAVCKSLLTMLGGEISVTSAPGRGTTFTVTLPVRQPEEPAARSMIRDLAAAGFEGDTIRDLAAASAPAAAPRPVRFAGSVLVAEDGVDNRLLLGTLLTRHGLAVDLAKDGQVAVDKAMAARAGGSPYDLILMDMQMPVLDGYSAASALRARGYAGAIAAVTAHAMEGERERCIAAGCDYYLSKPVDRGALVELLRRHTRPAPVSPPRAEGPPLLSSYADQADMRPLIQRFADSLPARVRDLQAAAGSARDAAVLRTLLHQLKGAAGGYGFASISELAGKVEDALMREPAAGQALLGELVTLCRRVQPS